MRASTIAEAEFQLGLDGSADQNSLAEHPGGKTGVGILIGDAMNRRLIEAATTHLELIPVDLEVAELSSAKLAALEIIIAEEPKARAIQALLAEREEHAEGINPAIVAVHLIDRPHNPTDLPSDTPFDGVLTLPLDPAPLVAQLSLILYAHRAFARRYNSALEELHLNRRIFRSVTSGISVANATIADMPLVYVNPAFEVMTGFALEEVVGRNCRFLQRGDTDQPGLTIIRQALRDRRETSAVLKNYRKDGTAFWNELSLSPIRNREGEVTHIVGIQTDVTARVEFESALRESEKLAAVGRLASSIAHEINNPLESVTNLLFLARQTNDPAQIHRFLNVADQELRRVALITAQSLRFYKQSTRPQAVRPAELLESVLGMYSGQLDNAHVVVARRDRSGNHDPDQNRSRDRENTAAAETRIVCLESEIRQVLNNLVRNAIDAMRGAGGTLSVRTRNGTNWLSGAKGVVITLADTGTGMSRDTQRNIYTAFFTTKGISGTGLGLWISGEIVNRHQGRLLVRSSQHSGRSGTVFELFLPIQGVVS